MKEDDEHFQSYMRVASDAHLDDESLFNTLRQQSPFFSDMSERCPTFMKEMKKVARDRIYMPGDSVVQEGQRGDSMFIIVSGKLTIRSSFRKPSLGEDINTRNKAFMRRSSRSGYGGKQAQAEVDASSDAIVGTLTGGGICGELAMLGVAQIRMATLIASSICLLWEIDQETGMALLQRFPEADEHFSNLIAEHLAPTVNACMLSLPLFRNFDTKIKTFLAVDSTRKAMFPGHTLVKEGKPGH